MASQDYFDPTYVGAEQTNQGVKERSEIKRLLKETTSEAEMARYGSSKPRRVIIKGKILDGKS